MKSPIRLSLGDNMDDGMRGRNAKSEKGQERKLEQKCTSGSFLSTPLASRHTCTLPIPESGQQAGSVTGMTSVDRPASLNYLQWQESSSLTASGDLYQTAQCLGGVLLESPGLCLYGSSSVPQISTFT